MDIENLKVSKERDEMAEKMIGNHSARRLHTFHTFIGNSIKLLLENKVCKYLIRSVT